MLQTTVDKKIPSSSEIVEAIRERLAELESQYQGVKIRLENTDVIIEDEAVAKVA